MRRLLMVIGVIAAVLMIVVSATMNFLFMKGFGKTAAEGLALGGVSVAADLLKVSLPFTVAAAWRARKVMFVVLGSIAFALFTAFSLASALGFTAEARSQNSAGRHSVTIALAEIDARLQQVRGQAQQIVAHRPPAVVETELKRLQQNVRWDSTKGCTEATASASREFCEGYFKLTGELAAGQEASRLAKTIEGLEARGNTLRADGGGQDQDPQVGLLARVLRADRSMIETALIIGAALLVELGSGLGLWLAVGGRIHGSSERDVAHVAHSETHITTNDDGGGAETRSVGSRSMEQRPVVDVVSAQNEIEDAQDVVERYCLSRLIPVDRQGLTVAALYADYDSWRMSSGGVRIDEAAFAVAFARIATVIGIEKDDDRYVGISVGPAPLYDTFPGRDR